MSDWRNRQTRGAQVSVPKGMRVQVPHQTLIKV